MRRCRRSTRQSRLTDLRGALSYRRPATHAEAAAGTVEGPLRPGPEPRRGSAQEVPMSVPESVEASTPYWRGINHLALVTNDMDAPVRLYHGTPGACLPATSG